MFFIGGEKMTSMDACLIGGGQQLTSVDACLIIEKRKKNG